MKLFTKEGETELQKQFESGSDLGQKVVIKIFNPYGAWKWYLMNQDPNEPDYLWGIVKGNEVEMGSVLKSDLENLKVKPFNFPLERDLHFKPRPAKEIFDDLLAGKHV